MREYLNFNDKLIEVRLLLTHPAYKNKIVVVLEGRTDIKLFTKLFDSSTVKIEQIGGKTSVMRLVEILTIDGKGKVVGICDADFDNFLKNSDHHENVFLTDDHDMEIALFHSNSFYSFLCEYSANDLKCAELNENLFSICVKECYELGLLKLLNRVCGLKLKFSALKLTNYCQAKGYKLNLDYDRYIKDLILCSPSASRMANFYFIKELFLAYKAYSFDPKQVCSGHDLADIVAILMSQPGFSSESSVSKSDVETALRLAYTSQDFNKLELSAKLNSALAGYKIFS